MNHSIREVAHDPTRDEVDRLRGLVVLEFGAHWCGHCASLRPHLTKLFEEFPQVRHVLIEDGKGQPLGRSFRIKLWPTLVFMTEGKELRRVVRPTPEEARAGFQALIACGPSP
jgi:thioredoxin 1